MQKKIGTILDENLLKKAKEKAFAQHTTLSHIFEEALSEYLQRKKQDSSCFSTVEASFGALRISTKDLRSALAEDIYETD